MVAVDGIVSPTSSGNDHLTKKGFARFIRKPLSLNTVIVADHPMLVNINDLFCPSLGMDEYVGVLPSDETEYHYHFSIYSLSGI